MKSNLSQDKCMDALEPHLAAIHNLIHAAFRFYQDRYPAEVIAQHNNATAANCVHDHILHEVNSAFSSIRGIRVLNARGLKVLNAGDKVVCRFKKVDGAGRSRSYPTKQALDFDRQLPLPLIPPAATRLTIGYEPDAAFASIERILVSCPLGGTILWCSQVNVQAGKAAWIDITPKRFDGTERYRRYDDER